MVLVTGATGLLGTHLLYQLTNQGKSITALYRNMSSLKKVESVFAYLNPNYKNLLKKINWVQVSLFDTEALASIIKEVKEIYHCAAFVSFAKKDAKKIYKTNVEATQNLVNLAIEFSIQKFCFVSSIATLSQSKKEFIDEDAEWGFNSSSGYGYSKYAAEMEVWRASQEGVPVIIVNPGVILDISHDFSSSAHLLNPKKKNLFFTNGVTGFVSASDVAKGMVQLMTSALKNERFVWVSENKSYHEILTDIAHIYAKKPPLLRIPKCISEIAWRFIGLLSFITPFSFRFNKSIARSIHQKKYFSAQKAIQKLDFSFEPISDTLQRVAAFHRQKS